MSSIKQRVFQADQIIEIYNSDGRVYDFGERLFPDEQVSPMIRLPV